MAATMAECKIKPIGFFRGLQKNKAAIPRQGILSRQLGSIHFEGYSYSSSHSHFDFKSALQGLEKMSHVWVIFLFHEAQAKPKPLVRPPRNPEIQVGVWATRSPYRPNSLGLTLAKIVEIKAGKLILAEIDLLDGTPILDLKPYVSESDRPRKITQGWIDEIKPWKYRISQKANRQIIWLETNGLPEIKDVLESQFGIPPLKSKRKRIKQVGQNFELSYRTWRILFKINEQTKRSFIIEINSGYSPTELQMPPENDPEQNQDKYNDKAVHQAFKSNFK